MKTLNLALDLDESMGEDPDLAVALNDDGTEPSVMKVIPLAPSFLQT